MSLEGLKKEKDRKRIMQDRRYGDVMREQYESMSISEQIRNASVKKSIGSDLDSREVFLIKNKRWLLRHL